MNVDSKVQRIIDWRESISVLPDSQFFDVIRVYLGEVKTPYNKQKLLEEVSSFLRKDENKKNIVNLLSESDLKIISTVKFIGEADNSKLEKFFENEWSVKRLYEQILNLQERLILYYSVEKNNQKKIIKINPLLEDVLNPYLSLNNVISFLPSDKKIFSDDFILNPSCLLAFISFMIQNPDACKMDYTLKKKSISFLESVSLGDKKILFEFLIKSFLNLSLLQEKKNQLFINWKVLESFFKLNFQHQLIYLCAANVGHFSKKTLLKNAQVFSDTLKTLGNNLYFANSINQISYLIKESSGEESKLSRFSQILAKAESKDEELEFSDSTFMLKMIDAACVFGILKEQFVEEKKILQLNEAFYNNDFVNSQKKSLSVDASFRINLMMGFSLESILPLLKISNLVQFNFVSTYEINKQTVMRAFDLSLSVDDILNFLEESSMYSIPKNLSFSIEEWRESYLSACLYKGYVLKVTKENIPLVEKNPIIAEKIFEVLAPGVYLLNVENEEEVKSLLENTNFNFLGKIIKTKKEQSFENLYPLRPSKVSLSFYDDSNQNENFVESFACNQKEQEKILEGLKKLLDSMTLTYEQRFGLEDRIERKIIVNPIQLRPESVRFEQIEATGMDFTGKIHLIESAIEKSYLLEIELEDKNTSLVGRPVSLNKKTTEAEVQFILEPENETVNIPVAKAVRIKRIRGKSYEANSDLFNINRKNIKRRS